MRKPEGRISVLWILVCVLCVAGTADAASRQVIVEKDSIAKGKIQISAGYFVYPYDLDGSSAVAPWDDMQNTAMENYMQHAVTDEALFADTVMQAALRLWIFSRLGLEVEAITNTGSNPLILNGNLLFALATGRMQIYLGAGAVDIQSARPALGGTYDIDADGAPDANWQPGMTYQLIVGIDLRFFNTLSIGVRANYDVGSDLGAIGGNGTVNAAASLTLFLF